MKYKFEQLINRSYQAIKERGLIKDDTSAEEFIDKCYEEMDEVSKAVYVNDACYVEELTDLATVCIMQIHHMGYNFIDEFEKVVVKNEKRATDGKSN